MATAGTTFRVNVVESQDASTTVNWSYLGNVSYRQALDLQFSLRNAILQGTAPHTLLLLEHPPVITLGRSADRHHVLGDPAELEKYGIDVVPIERGGDVTYHGPGQLVGYPLRQVGRGVRDHICAMVKAIRTLLMRYNIESRWDESMPGVWTDRGKIAAFGVDARGGVSMHGFALNVCPDLSHYRWIVPCGLAAPVTSMQQFGVPLPSLEILAAELVPLLADAFGETVQRVAPDVIWRDYA